MSRPWFDLRRQLELFEMVDAGHMALAGAYLAATLALGFFAVRGGIALERRPELVE